MRTGDKKILGACKKVRTALSAKTKKKKPDYRKILLLLQDIINMDAKQLNEEMVGLIDVVVLIERLIYDLQEGVPDADRVKGAVVHAATVIEQVLTTKVDARSLSEARVGLYEVLENGARTNAGALPGHKDADLADTTLDDIAAQFVQLEPQNMEQWERMRNLLFSYSSEATHPIVVREIIEQILERVKKVIEGNGVEPQQTISEISSMIDGAQDILEMETDHSEPSLDDEQKREKHTSDQRQFDYLPADVDPVLLDDFINENQELILDAEAALLSLELDPDNMESVKTVFRAFHNIKGTANFLNLMLISDLAHRAETLINEMLEGTIRCRGVYADLVLRSIDMLKELIYVVQETSPGEPVVIPEGYDELVHWLEAPETADIRSVPVKDTGSSLRLGDILVAQGKLDRGTVEQLTNQAHNQPLGLKVVRSKKASLTDVAHALRVQQKISGLSHFTESSVRVRTDRLDRLIDTIGELVIAHSMVAEDATSVQNSNYDFMKKVAHTGKIVRTLQDLSMSMRMVPLKATFHKLTRLIRDLAHRSNKVVNFTTSGDDTEIDRNMVELVKDPLVHLVRNAIDHGIEMPEVREKQGKPRAGTVRLSAYHAGGSVIVEVQDDGKGLNKKKIIQRAVEKGLIASSQTISDNDVFNLIFHPGFSTADKVTEVSGRGVGLDIVKKGVELLRGRIDVDSSPGKGCLFSLRVPLTMAITDGMLVKVGHERYIIPTVSIKLSFRPSRDKIRTVAGRGEIVLFRDAVIPVFRLHRLFNIPSAISDPTKGILVLIEAAGSQCALLVDELLGQLQVVAKSLGDGIGKISGISGGAVLGDGRVGLIIDTAGVVALTRETIFSKKEELYG